MPSANLGNRGVPDRVDGERLAATPKRIADPDRPQVLAVLRAQPRNAACVCPSIEPLELPQPTVSHRITVLHAAGILELDCRGSWIY